MNDDLRSNKSASFDMSGIQSQLVQVSDVHLNVSQEFIITTEDKFKLCLTTYLSGLECKRAWITPFGIFATVFATLLTAEFRDFGFKAAMWQSTFLIGACISFGWMVLAIYRAFTSCTVDDLVAAVKRSSPRTQSGGFTAQAPDCSKHDVVKQRPSVSGSGKSNKDVRQLLSSYLTENPGATTFDMLDYMRINHGIAMFPYQLLSLLREPRLSKLWRSRI